MAIRVLGLIYRSFVRRTSEIILPLNKSIVRPHLEYCVQAWCSYFKKYTELLEKVQHRATKMMTDLREKTYKDRLRAWHLMTLETRSIRGDLIETFKIMKGHVDVDYSSFFSLYFVGSGYPSGSRTASDVGYPSGTTTGWQVGKLCKQVM